MLQIQITILKKRVDDTKVGLKAERAGDWGKFRTMEINLLSMKGKTEIETQEHTKTDIFSLDYQCKITRSEKLIRNTST